MAKVKIYLSKSKNVDQGVLDSVLKHLSAFDVDVTWFDGKKEAYSHKKIDQADIVLVLSHTLPKAFHYDFPTSKGVYEEIDYCISDDKPLLAVICVGDELFVSPIEEIEENPGNPNWDAKYANIYCAEIMHELDYLSKFEDFDGPVIKRKKVKQSESDLYASTDNPMVYKGLIPANQIESVKPMLACYKI